MKFLEAFNSFNFSNNHTYSSLLTHKKDFKNIKMEINCNSGSFRAVAIPVFKKTLKKQSS